VTTKNTFAGAQLDRVSERRTDSAWLEERLADPSSRALLVAQGAVYVDHNGEPPRPLLVSLGPAEEPVLLGVGAQPTPRRTAPGRWRCARPAP